MSSTSAAGVQKGMKGHKIKGGKRRGHVREVKGTFNKNCRHDNSLRNHTVSRNHDQTSALAKLIPALWGKEQRTSRGFVEALSAVMHAIINQMGRQIDAHTASTKTVKLRHIKAVLGNLLVETSLHQDVLNEVKDAYSNVQAKERASRTKKQTKRASSKE